MSEITLFIRQKQLFSCVCHKFSFCRTNITDTNRYSLENVLLSFFHPPSFVVFRFFALSCLAPSISPSTSAALLHNTASVSADTRGTSKSFVLPPRCLPFPSPCPSVSPCARFSSFFRVQIELYERVSARKFLATRGRKGKGQMEISYAFLLFFKIVREIHRVFEIRSRVSFRCF